MAMRTESQWNVPLRGDLHKRSSTPRPSEPTSGSLLRGFDLSNSQKVKSLWIGLSYIL